MYIYIYMYSMYKLEHHQRMENHGKFIGSLPASWRPGHCWRGLARGKLCQRSPGPATLAGDRLTSRRPPLPGDMVEARVVRLHRNDGTLKKGIRGFTCKQADTWILVQEKGGFNWAGDGKSNTYMGISLTSNGEVSQEWGTIVGHPQVRNERGKQEV